MLFASLSYSQTVQDIGDLDYSIDFEVNSKAVLGNEPNVPSMGLASRVVPIVFRVVGTSWANAKTVWGNLIDLFEEAGKAGNVITISGSDPTKLNGTYKVSNAVVKLPSRSFVVRGAFVGYKIT
jgi:hypothetical protein